MTITKLEMPKWMSRTINVNVMDNLSSALTLSRNLVSFKKNNLIQVIENQRNPLTFCRFQKNKNLDNP